MLTDRDRCCGLWIYFQRGVWQTTAQLGELNSHVLTLASYNLARIMPLTAANDTRVFLGIGEDSSVGVFAIGDDAFPGVEWIHLSVRGES